MSSGLLASRQPVSSSSTSLELREKQAKVARKVQLKSYQEIEVMLGEPVRPKTSKITIEPQCVLRDAVNNMDMDQMRDVLVNGLASPNTVSEASGVSLLHLCCLNNFLPGVKCLLEHGANINIQDNDLWTSLHVAAACGHKEIVQLLLENNADCTLLDVDGNFACDTSRHPETRTLLVEHMSLTGIKESDMRFIRSSMAKAMLAAVKECIVRMMDLNQLNQNGVAPLHVAAANGYREAAMLLLDLGGAAVDCVDDIGYTPLHIAAKYNQTKLVYLLLSRGADSSLQSHKLELAIDMTDNDEIIGLLELTGNEEGYHIRPSILPIITPLTPSRVDTVSIDLEQFESAQTVSKSLDLETPMSKLEALFEGETLVERDNFDEGVDVCTQRPALRRLRGSLLQKRTDGKLNLPDPSSTDNLATLSDLTEDIVLRYLRDRYSKDQIYTYIGEILVAINPFKPLSIYSNLASETYSKRIPDPSLPPHVFAVANEVYRDMLTERRAQCCVISGESGAGKTETSKYLVQQLLFISDSVEKELNVKIEQVTPILEAFGNAKTAMNNNSSRFGKFLELSFSDEGIVLGASFKEYLLEKSRIVNHGKGERNFHIFYQLFAGLSAEEKMELKLDEPEMHRCLSGIRESLEGVLTSKMDEDFNEVRDSLEAIGFSKQEERNMLQTLAAIVHILDVTFDTRGEGVELSNKSLTSVIATLLQIDPRELALCLVQEATITRGEPIVRHRSLFQANDCRDALAKALYGRMFGWIINGVNHHLQPETVKSRHSTKVGVLDIFGFENFEKNNFEQMCINIANEQLQHFFNEHIFKWEQEECQKEGVATDAITYTSNWTVVNLFVAKNVGILSLIDEESKFPRSTDHTLAEKLHKTHWVCDRYQAPPDRGPKFTVSHYAGQVKYDVLGFLDKNRDTFPPSILQLLRTSASLLVREMFEAKLTHTGSIAPSKRQRMSRKAESPFSHFNRKASRRLTRLSRRNAQRSPVGKTSDTGRRAPLTIANHFKCSLSDLMEKLNSSSPHFIRCIKPNVTKQPNSFATDYVARQLKYVGVMETTRIRQCGYPVRLTYEDFLTRFDVLRDFYTYEPNKPPLTDYRAVGVVLEKVGVSGWVNGLHKVFLKFQHPLQLDRHSQHILMHIIAIQRWFRELKEWKAAQEALKIKREQAKKAKQVSTSSDMTHYKRSDPGLQVGWGNGHRNVSSVQNGGKNSNHNNSRSSTKPKGFVVPTSPPSYDHCMDSDNDSLIDEDIYDSVIKQNFSSIKSLPLTEDIMLTSPPPQEEIEIIYDSAEGALQAESGDYYNYDDVITDEIYDDVQPSQTVPVAEIIEEDIYDDATCADVFRNTTTSATFDPPHPSRPLPPSMDEEEAMYSDASSVFQAPSIRTVSPKVEHFTMIPENDEALYTDASSLFDAPPTQSIPQVKSLSPKFTRECPSETYEYLSNTEINEGMSSMEETRSQSPAPPPLPFRSPNLRKIGKARSTPNSIPEVPASHPRRSSEQLSVTPLTKPPSPPRNKHVVARKRSKAIKSRSDSESSSYSDAFSSPPPTREDKRHPDTAEKFLLPTIPAGVTVTTYNNDGPVDEDYAEINDGPVDEDYAEIEDCHELSYPDTSPSEYLTPVVKQKPHRKLQQSRSAGPGDMSPRDPVNRSIDTRPRAPLPVGSMKGNPPPKPPRTRSTSVMISPPNKRAQPSTRPIPHRKTALLSDTPTAPPPLIPGRHIRCADTPITAPPPRPVRKTLVSPQPSRNAPPVTRGPASVNPPPPSPPQRASTQGHLLPTAEPSISSSGLLSGLQSVQLKKTVAKPSSNAPPKQESTDSTGNLMAQMQAFKLKKTTRKSEEDSTPLHPDKNNVSVSEEAHGSPVHPRVPRHKKPPPPLPSRQSTPHFNVTTSQEPKTNNGIPEWKRNIIEKRKREQEEFQNAERGAEAKWGAVPAWKQKLLREK